MRVLDLFSGIGGFSLGLERAGMQTVAFCEIDPFCRAVLAKHWPGVPIYDDVRNLTAARLRADGISVELVCGGFPCQDISVAGKGGGLAAERSGLWREYARIIAKYDHATLSWKTSQRCFFGDLETYSETWPRSGMTRNGTAYQLPPLVPLTDEIASGWLPTPTTKMNQAAPSMMKQGSACRNLRERMWPTPTARDWKDGSSIGSAPVNGLLGRAVDPSPERGSLSPTWVEWLMGFPDGWTDLGHSEMPSSRKSRS